MNKLIYTLAVSTIFTISGAPLLAAESGKVTLIHMGDVHGHLIPRPNLRSDGNGLEQGGLARMYTKIQEIRKQNKYSILFNTGDTTQGSAEAMYTRGQALVDVVNKFGVEVFTPGNWDYVYGTERFMELFAGTAPIAPWNAIAANLYYDGEPYAAKTGQRVLPAYMIKKVGNLKIGIFSITTDRGPQVVGKTVTKGFKFTPGDVETKEMVKLLREQEHVDLVIMASELGVSKNIYLAETVPGIDILLASDQHEITRKPIVSSNGTVVVEEGQDGIVLGELEVHVKDGKMQNWTWKLHTIDSKIKEDANIAKMIKDIRKTFVTGSDFKQHINPFNNTKLERPIDTVVGYTKIALHRNNFSHENMPAVIEGSAHDFLTDAFRAQTGATIGAIRGFRYGTHIAPGPIKMEDLYHFMPIGAMIARGNLKGKAIKGQIENACDGSLNPKVFGWTGGWLFNFSGLTMNLHPYAEKGARASGIKIFNAKTSTWEPLNPEADYSYASYYYQRDPDLINTLPAENITVLADEQGKPLDGVEVVVRYLASLPDKTANPDLNRIKLLMPLPLSRDGSPEMQPWRGAQ